MPEFGRGLSSNEKTQLVRIINQVTDVFNSKAFEEALNSISKAGGGFRFTREDLKRISKGRKIPLKFFAFKSDELTGADVLKRIRRGTGSETAEEGPTSIHFKISIYRFISLCTSAVAHTKAGTIYINRSKFNSRRIAGNKEPFFGFCNTVAHELMHVMGYDHTPGGKWEADSVPYVVGDIVEQLLYDRSPY